MKFNINSLPMYIDLTLPTSILIFEYCFAAVVVVTFTTVVVVIQGNPVVSPKASF